MAAASIPKNSVWSAMNYTPPRGKCNYKTSLVSPACPCMRFMLHPIKAATSFECDGCNHHASFHALENAAEDAVLRKWAERDASDRERSAAGGPDASKKKRKMIAESGARDDDVFEVFHGSGTRVASSTAGRVKSLRNR